MEFVRRVLPKAGEVNHASILASEAPVGALPLAEYFTFTLFPASVVNRILKVLSSIFLSVGEPVLASINMPTGHPVIIELKIEIEEFLRICAPARNRLFPELLKVALGPTAVILLNTALVLGRAVEPLELLSLSKASEVDISAITESRITNPNCTLPLYPLSVSKSSSCVF